jgi:hypothetical protein
LATHLGPQSIVPRDIPGALPHAARLSKDYRNKIEYSGH